MTFGLEPLFDELQQDGYADWSHQLRTHADEAFDPASHGKMQEWLMTLESLPSIEATYSDFNVPAVTFDGVYSRSQHQELRDKLKTLRPWRKGPFQVFGVNIDAEWRSDLKWSRVAKHLSLVDKDVLDVGCGNGYYGWRMIGAGAKRVVGLEPYALYNVQHAALKKYAADVPNYVVPGSDQQLPRRLGLFDVAFSMGVLYHCRDPFGHLRALRNALKAGGELVLETLVVEGDEATVLVPESRYAKMRNVWFIPSTQLLKRMLSRGEFHEVSIVDVSVTQAAEQRATPWMTFESLSDFLDPADRSKTVEGYPAPRRAIAIARTRAVS